jgi:hypothetical protein
MSIEAMKQALDALEEHGTHYARHEDNYIKAITALRQAIEQAEKQEPVAFRNTETGEFCTGGFLRKDWAKWQPLYAAPREWIGLKDEDLPEGETYDFDRGVRWAERYLKEKNHG